MSRPATRTETISVGQLAKRWGLGVARIRHLVESGQIPAAFRIPSSGRFGQAVRIPLASVIALEQAWAIAPTQSRIAKRLPTHGRPTQCLRNFPELEQDGLQLAPESAAGDPS